MKKRLLLTLFILNFLCASPNDAQPFGSDILLIINYNFPYYASTTILQELYSPYFPNIVFYGPKPCPGIHLCRHHEGWFTYMTIADAMQRYPNYKGYLQIHDDCIINCWNFTRFNKDKIWFISSPSIAPLSEKSLSDWAWWSQKVGYHAAQTFYDTLTDKYKNILISNCGPNSIAWGYSDIVYFPKTYAHDVITLCQLAKTSNLFLEIALPSMCCCLEEINNWEVIKGIALWEDKHLIIEQYTKEMDFAHPIKLSKKKNIEFIKSKFLNMWLH